MRFIGLDLGTKTGAMVELFSDDTYQVLSSWTKGPKTTQFLETIDHMEKISIFPKGGGWVGADWSPYEVFLRGNRVAIQMKAFAFGYILHKALGQGYKTVFITPTQVRNHFEVKKNADKFVVQSAFKQIWKGAPIKLATEHELDALILAYILRNNYNKTVVAR